MGDSRPKVVYTVLTSSGLREFDDRVQAQMVAMRTGGVLGQMRVQEK